MHKTNKLTKKWGYKHAYDKALQHGPKKRQKTPRYQVQLIMHLNTTYTQLYYDHYIFHASFMLQKQKLSYLYQKGTNRTFGPNIGI